MTNKTTTEAMTSEAILGELAGLRVWLGQLAHSTVRGASQQGRIISERIDDLGDELTRRAMRENAR